MMEYVTLSNGIKMPILGYGVYQVTKEECEHCVLDALSVGYRHIDTAQSYFNEEEVGSAIEKSGVPREDIFLTTKVWIEHYGYEQTKASVAESLRKLKTDYLDLVLLLLYSGDTGFYSGASGLLPMLRACGISCRVLPGISSVQLLAAAVGRPWQDWKLVSAHGCACDPVAECLTADGRPVFFLTGGSETPATLCRTLTAAGLGQAHALVGEQLGTPEEKIFFGTAQEVSQKNTASLSVLLIEHLPQPPRRCAGFPDEAFLRGDVPMTKQEVRAAALAKLAVRPTDTLWDVGAGTGSVSVELALAAPRGRVYAVECDPEACALIRKNRERFAAWNLTLIEGKAPQALEALPAPDAVFLGGTKGSMEAVVDAVLAKNPQARLCISAIALETLSAAVAALTARGLTAEVTQIAVSRTKPAGRLHLLMANNPIFLITGERK